MKKDCNLPFWFLLLLAILVVLILPKKGKSAGMPEAWYQRSYCTAKIEHRLPDGTRVDCLTATHAIEYDFVRKWYEAIGQSLYYAMHTGRRAGIALIIESDDDLTYFNRAERTINHYGLPIDVYKIDGTIQ